MTRVKICGIQPGDDLMFTHFPEVTHVGIVFVPTSRRYVLPENARSIVEDVHPTCKTMGVFVNDTESIIVDVLETSGVQGAQLHGDEPPDFCRAIRKQGFIVWKAIPVGPMDSVTHLSEEIQRYADAVDAILLDAAPPREATPGLTGGYGHSFDWTVLSQLAADFDAVPPIWIAGGLNANNVSSLLRTFKPFGIDVSSGVEIHGRKSVERIVTFIEEASGHAS